MYNRPVKYTKAAVAKSNNDVQALHGHVQTHSAQSAYSDLSLIQLFRQHQHQQGWILLVAPTQLPDKSWAEQYQLSLHNVLVIHPKQISDLSATLQQALTSSHCKVVINFANQLDEQQLESCRQLALLNNIWFYQREQLSYGQHTH